jgi:hypothetical protein
MHRATCISLSALVRLARLYAGNPPVRRGVLWAVRNDQGTEQLPRSSGSVVAAGLLDSHDHTCRPPPRGVLLRLRVQESELSPIHLFPAASVLFETCVNFETDIYDRWGPANLHGRRGLLEVQVPMAVTFLLAGTIPG